jgi:protein transport protein SEC13
LQVIIWKEVSEGSWQQAYVSPATLHSASVNSCAWAPHELGLVLAAGSSDGALSVLSAAADGSWHAAKVERAHLLGVTSVSWAPAQPPGSLVTPGSGAPLVRRLASGGCDNLVKIWEYSEQRGEWAVAQTLEGHGDWVRDVAWAPNLGMPKNTIASAGQDGKVYVWTQAEPNGRWEKLLLADFGKTVVWRVSWSVFGNVLAVADGSNAVTLWKEAVDGKWSQVSDDAAATSS